MLFLARNTSKNHCSCLPGSWAGALPGFWLTKSQSKGLLLKGVQPSVQNITVWEPCLDAKGLRSAGLGPRLSVTALQIPWQRRKYSITEGGRGGGGNQYIFYIFISCRCFAGMCRGKNPLGPHRWGHLTAGHHSGIILPSGERWSEEEPPGREAAGPSPTARRWQGKALAERAPGDSARENKRGTPAELLLQPFSEHGSFFFFKATKPPFLSKPLSVIKKKKRKTKQEKDAENRSTEQPSHAISTCRSTWHFHSGKC